MQPIKNLVIFEQNAYEKIQKFLKKILVLCALKNCAGWCHISMGKFFCDFIWFLHCQLSWLWNPIGNCLYQNSSRSFQDYRNRFYIVNRMLPSGFRSFRKFKSTCRDLYQSTYKKVTPRSILNFKNQRKLDKIQLLQATL